MKISLRDLVRRAKQYCNETRDDKMTVQRQEMRVLLHAAGVRKIHHLRQTDGRFRLDVIYRGQHFVYAASDTMGSLFPRRRAA